MVNGAIACQVAWQILAALAALTIPATMVSVASGLSGGLFAPTVVSGAMIGGAVRGAEHALIGMSALSAGADRRFCSRRSRRSKSGLRRDKARRTMMAVERIRCT